MSNGDANDESDRKCAIDDIYSVVKHRRQIRQRIEEHKRANERETSRKRAKDERERTKKNQRTPSSSVRDASFFPSPPGFGQHHLVLAYNAGSFLANVTRIQAIWSNYKDLFSMKLLFAFFAPGTVHFCHSREGEKFYIVSQPRCPPVLSPLGDIDGCAPQRTRLDT